MPPTQRTRFLALLARTVGRGVAGNAKGLLVSVLLVRGPLVVVGDTGFESESGIMG